MVECGPNSAIIVGAEIQRTCKYDWFSSLIRYCSTNGFAVLEEELELEEEEEDEEDVELCVGRRVDARDEVWATSMASVVLHSPPLALLLSLLLLLLLLVLLLPPSSL